MAVSSHPQKLEAKINSGDIFVGLVWLVLNAAMILTGLWRDAGPTLAAIDVSGLF
jgi:hypothetical protein